jgi:hypothetical protein
MIKLIKEIKNMSESSRSWVGVGGGGWGWVAGLRENKANSVFKLSLT